MFSSNHFSISSRFTCFSRSRFFRVEVFQGPGFSEPRFFRVQVFKVRVLGPGSGSRVRVQVIEVAVSVVTQSTFTWEAKWTHTGLRFQTGVKTLLFTWTFISAAFQNDPIFWWTCVGISFRVVFTWYRKIPDISPGLILFQRYCLGGL